MQEVSQDNIREEEIALTQSVAEIENLLKDLKTEISDLERNNSGVVRYNILKSQLNSSKKAFMLANREYNIYKRKHCDHKFLIVNKVATRINHNEPDHDFLCLKCQMLLAYGRWGLIRRNACTDAADMEQKYYNWFPFGPSESQILPIHLDAEGMSTGSIEIYGQVLFDRVMKNILENASVEEIAKSMSELVEQDKSKPMEEQEYLRLGLTYYPKSRN